MTMRRNRKSAKRGAALITALVIMVIIAGVAAAALVITSSQIHTTGTSMQHDQAFHVAETGLAVTQKAFDLAAQLGQPARSGLGSDSQIADQVSNLLGGALIVPRAVLIDKDPSTGLPVVGGTVVTDPELARALREQVPEALPCTLRDIISPAWDNQLTGYDMALLSQIGSKLFTGLYRYDRVTDSYRVAAVGFHGKQMRIIEAGFLAQNESPWSLGLFAKEELDYQGTADSYNSAGGPYAPRLQTLPDGSTAVFANMNAKIGSNGQMQIEEGGVIFGDVMAGPGEEVENDGTIWGEAGNLPEPHNIPSIIITSTSTVRNGVTTYTNSYTVNGGDPFLDYRPPTPVQITSGSPFYLGTYSATGSGRGGRGGGNQSPVLDQGVYHADSINLTGNKTVTINGTVVIYVHGSIEIGGNSKFDIGPGDKLIILQTDRESYGPDSGLTFNGQVTSGNTETYDTTQFQIYTSQRNVRINGMGHGKFVGVLYAPEAEIDFNGGVDIYGAVIGNEIETEGAAGRFHYDERLANLGGSSTRTYKRTSWFLRK